jgi:hypothetical protein
MITLMLLIYTNIEKLISVTSNMIYARQDIMLQGTGQSCVALLPARYYLGTQLLVFLELLAMSPIQKNCQLLCR